MLGLRGKLLLFSVFATFVLLQGRLWFATDGWAEVVRLRNDVARQAEENSALAERNSRMRAEVTDLRNGVAALEERARADLGMIAEGESFFLWAPDSVARVND